MLLCLLCSMGTSQLKGRTGRRHTPQHVGYWDRWPVGPSVLDFQGLSVKQHYPGLSILSLLPKITSDYKDHILWSYFRECRSSPKLYFSLGLCPRLRCRRPGLTFKEISYYSLVAKKLKYDFTTTSKKPLTVNQFQSIHSCTPEPKFWRRHWLAVKACAFFLW